MKSSKFILAVAGASLAGLAGAEVMDRPVGIQIGQRLTLKPYVSVSATYDSNAEACKDGGEDVIWTANPSLGLDWKGDSWELIGNIYYQYNAYTKGNNSKVANNSNKDSYHGYGEDLTFQWDSTRPGEKGWALMLTEKYMRINSIGDITLASGQGYNRNRQEFKGGFAFERRFTEHFHADINANYYWLDYDNDSNDGSYGLYGWDRWIAGLEAGYAFSSWTDLLISGAYQNYTQDNASSYYLSNQSQGFSVMAGLGSYATERIQYRVLGGWSCFRYADEETLNGFTYSASGNWKIGETWNMMLLASAYYQPSETQAGSATRTDSFSWGVGKSMIRGKLTGTFDLAYRRQTTEYTYGTSTGYDQDLATARLGLNYTLNRYIGLFGNMEYLMSLSDRDYYEYNRFRVTVGARLTY